MLQRSACCTMFMHSEARAALCDCIVPQDITKGVHRQTGQEDVIFNIYIYIYIYKYFQVRASSSSARARCFSSSPRSTSNSSIIMLMIMSSITMIQA